MIAAQSRTIKALLWVAISLALAGCTGVEGRPEAAPPPAGWPASLDELTFVWDGAEGIDVAAGAAVVVRAYTESYYLADLTADQKYLYPGFTDAVDPNDRWGPEPRQYLWPDRREPQEWVGTLRHRILSITRADRDVTVIGCSYTYGLGEFVDQGAGWQAIVGGNPDYSPGVYVIRITLRAPEGADLALPAQQGPSRTPFDDVFGGWRVTGSESVEDVRAPRWDGIGRDMQACRDAGSAALQNKFTPMGRYPRSDFPTLPAAPGWPAPPES